MSGFEPRELWQAGAILTLTVVLTSEGMGGPRGQDLHAMRDLSNDICLSTNAIYQQLSNLCSSSRLGLPLQASITVRAPTAPPPTRTPIRANSLAFGLCGPNPNKCYDMKEIATRAHYTYIVLLQENI